MIQLVYKGDSTFQIVPNDKMYNVIDVIFTNIYLKPEEAALKKKYRYICNYPVDIGDILEDGFHRNPIEVINKDKSREPYLDGIELKEYYPTRINGKEVKNIYKPEVNMEKKDIIAGPNTGKKIGSKDMFNGLMSKVTSQYMPIVEEDVKVSLEGTICVPVTGGEYVSITDYKDNEGKTQYKLTKYDPSMTMDVVPVYSIEKDIDKIVIGDIVKSGKSYAKVIGKSADGLKTISFTGTKSTKVAPVDFLLGRPTMRVLVNYFNIDNSGFNPLLFAVMKGEFNMESLMLLSATPQGKKLFNNLSGTGFNPMFLALMNKDKEGDSGDSMLQTVMMMSMMGNGGMQNPLSNIFGGQSSVQSTPISEPTPIQTSIPTDTSELLSLSKKVDSLTDTVCKLSQLVMSDIGVLKNQKAQLKSQPKEQSDCGVQPDCNH